MKLDGISNYEDVELPAGNLGVSKEIQPKCPVGRSRIVSEGGKGTLNYLYVPFLGLQMA